MSIGRLSSMMASAQIVAAFILLTGFLPSAKADCVDDGDGLETCYGITNVGVYVASIVGAIVLLVLLSILIACRRRRIQRENLAHIQRAQAAEAGRIVQYPPNVAPGSESRTVTAVTLQYYVPADAATAAPTK